MCVVKCELCKNEMKESVARIKVKRGRKICEFPVNCMRCVECGSVRLFEAQVLEMPQEVTMDDFLAYVFLQDRVSTMRLQQKGLIKEEVPKLEKLIV